MPVGEGSLWDELMGFVGEPTEPEPVVESQSIKAGRMNDDGSYEPLYSSLTRRPGQTDPKDLFGPPTSITKAKLDDLFNQQYNGYMQSTESDILQSDARAVLKEVGFVIIEEGGTSMFDAMGGTVQLDDPIQAIYRNL